MATRRISTFRESDLDRLQAAGRQSLFRQGRRGWWSPFCGPVENESGLIEVLLRDAGMLDCVPAEVKLSYDQVLQALATSPNMVLVCEPYIVRAWREIAARRSAAEDATRFLQKAIAYTTEPLRPQGQPGPDSMKVARLFEEFLKRAKSLQCTYRKQTNVELTGDQLPVVDYRSERVTITQRRWPRAVALIFVGHLLDLKPDSIERHLKKAKKKQPQASAR